MGKKSKLPNKTNQSPSLYIDSNLRSAKRKFQVGPLHLHLLSNPPNILADVTEDRVGIDAADLVKLIRPLDSAETILARACLLVIENFEIY
jgi:hypothetical protein